MSMAAKRLERGWRTLIALVHEDEHAYLQHQAARQSETEHEIVPMAEVLRRMIRKDMEANRKRK